MKCTAKLLYGCFLPIYTSGKTFRKPMLLIHHSIDPLSSLHPKTFNKYFIDKPKWVQSGPFMNSTQKRFRRKYEDNESLLMVILLVVRNLTESHTTKIKNLGGGADK